MIANDVLFQPTGGPILLFDEDPDEPKSLVELKAKKRTAPPAPAPAASGTNGLSIGNSGLTDATAPLSGAAAAAGVLTAVDEDEEGAEEAPVPDEFEVDDDDEME